jgi:hypothetical protein
VVCDEAVFFSGGLPLYSPAWDLHRRGAAPSSCWDSGRRASSPFYSCSVGAVGLLPAESASSPSRFASSSSPGLLPLRAAPLVFFVDDPEVKSIPNPPYSVMAMMLGFAIILARDDLFV